MFKKHYFFMNEVDEHGGEGSASTEQATPPVEQATSILTQGQSAGEQSSELAFPEKYTVKKEDGTLDIEASARKLAEGYTNLEKRVGTGDLPPKTVDEYKIDMKSEAFTFDDFKAEPENQQFLQKAHELGMTQSQLEFVLSEYAGRLPELVQAGKELAAEEAQEQLSQVWGTEKEMKASLQHAYKAFQKFASPDDLQRIDDIGNNPIVIKLLANIGKQISEDGTAQSPVSSAQQADVKQLMASEAYRIHTHPDHKATHEQVRRYYEQMYGTQSVG